jgi:hypothetical protein
VNFAGCLSFTDSSLARRSFLRAGSLTLLGINLAQYFELKAASAAAGVHPGSQAKAQACILLWLEGGPSHVDTWDPQPNSSFKAISTNVPGIQVSELLPRCARHMDKLSIIRSMRTEELDHPEGTHYAITGHRINPAMQFPSLGSIIAKERGARNTVPPYILEPQWEIHRTYENFFKSAFLGPQYDPMVVPDPSQKDFTVPDLNLPKTVSLGRIQERRSLLKIVDHAYRQKEQIAAFADMDTFVEQGLRLITSPEVKAAFDMSQESEKTKEQYGRHRFGQSVLLARRLVEGGCRFVTAAGNKFNEWDTHSKNDHEHRENLVPKLDQALSALLEDLEQRGLLETTVVIAMGEFGRTPNVNANGGRDHWPHCWSLVLGGGGIKGGQVIGASDKGAQVADRMTSIGDVFATIYKAFGIDWTREYMTPVGRPVKIANSIKDVTGQPVKELI